MATGASSATSGAVSRTHGTDDEKDYPEEKPQRGGGGVREKVGGAVVARADDGRTVSLRTTEDFAGEVRTAADTSDQTTAEGRSGQGDSAIGALWNGANTSSALAAASVSHKWLAADSRASQGRKKHAGTEKTA